MKINVYKQVHFAIQWQNIYTSLTLQILWQSYMCDLQSVILRPMLYYYAFFLENGMWEIDTMCVA